MEQNDEISLKHWHDYAGAKLHDTDDALECLKTVLNNQKIMHRQINQLATYRQHRKHLIILVAILIIMTIFLLLY